MNTPKRDINKFHAIQFMLRFLDSHYSSKVVRCHIDLHRDLILHQSEFPHDPAYEFVVANIPEKHFSPETIFNDFMWVNEQLPVIPFARFQEAASLRSFNGTQHGMTLTSKEKDDTIAVFRAGIGLLKSSTTKKARDQAEKFSAILLPKLHHVLYNRIDQY